MHRYSNKLRMFMFGLFCLSIVSTTVAGFVKSSFAEGNEYNNNGIKESVLSRLMDKDIKVPHTKQITEDRKLKNLLKHEVEEADGALSILGHEITSVTDPHDDLSVALTRLSQSAENGTISTADAQEVKDILLGTTNGRIYDGFSLLNFNRWNEPSIADVANFPSDIMKDVYKTKVIRDTGETEPSFLDNGETVTIWEVDVNMLWYGQQFDSDTFLIKAPLEVNGKAVSRDDTLRINYHIYSLVKEDFAPTMVTLDANPSGEFPEQGGSVTLPHKGEDSVWVEVEKDTVAHISVQHTALRFFRGIYTWGWRVHPPRIQFLDFLFEAIDRNGDTVYEPRSLSMATRNAELDIAGISDVAPEKKLYSVINKALDGSITASELFAMLNDPANGPEGTYTEWVALMADQLQLPPEAKAVLAADGKEVSSYDFVIAFMNNEIYGESIFTNKIRDWKQGDVVNTKVINLDNHTHYYRNVDFGDRLNDDIASTQVNGIFSFEIMNFKPTYGAPKVAEMQWRAGWGFKPHFATSLQDGVFQAEDKGGLRPFAAPVHKEAAMEINYGYQYSADARKGDFPFNPPPGIIGSSSDPSFDRMYEFKKPLNNKKLEQIANDWEKFKKTNGRLISAGIVLGQETEGYGIAKMCEEIDESGFCAEDLNPFHFLDLKNFDSDGDGTADQLRFPPFLRNPGAGGDIIPPTPAWQTFLYVSPRNGTLYIDPEDKSKGHWVDLTYAHGTTVPAQGSIDTTIEMPRRLGQVFYQFDDLFHDNDIFSPHPISAQN